MRDDSFECVGCSAMVNAASGFGARFSFFFCEISIFHCQYGGVVIMVYGCLEVFISPKMEDVEGGTAAEY